MKKSLLLIAGMAMALSACQTTSSRQGLPIQKAMICPPKKGCPPPTAKVVTIPPLPSSAIVPQHVTQNVAPGVEAVTGLVSANDQEVIGLFLASEGMGATGRALVLSDIPLVVNRLVEAYIALYQGEKQSVFLRGIRRGGRYRPIIEEIFAAEGIPQDLFYLALVESAFNPLARSRAGAAGLWQFMPGTARLYGLRVDWWVDERYEIETSTRAAAKHLKDLYEDFNDWYLAMAAYNAGAGRVRRAIARSKTDDFWSLRLPTQTRNYVPAFIAAVILAKEPGLYGLTLEEDPPLATDVVMVPEGTDLSVIAEAAGADLETLEKINPHLRRGCVPPGKGEYLVRVPEEIKAGVSSGLAELPEDRRLSWDRYRIKSGDTLWSVARRAGVPVSILREVNGISGSRIIAGQYLLIPKTRTPSLVSRSRVASVSRQRVVHRVRRGENLWSISRRYGVTVKTLMAINNLKKTTIFPGQELVVHRGVEEETIYRVRSGDTLIGIARRHGISLSSLLKANRLNPDRIIRPGDRLRIPMPETG